MHTRVTEFMCVCVCVPWRTGRSVMLLILSLAVAELVGRGVSAVPSVEKSCLRRSQRHQGLSRADKQGLQDPDQWPQSAVLRPPQVPTGSNGASGAIFNISVCLAETTHSPKIRLHRLLTETSFLCFWLEVQQLSMNPCCSETLIASYRCF